MPKVKTGHLATELDLATIKEKLSHVRGHLVESPLEFVIDQKDLVEWPAFDPM